VIEILRGLEGSRKSVSKRYVPTTRQKIEGGKIAIPATAWGGGGSLRPSPGLWEGVKNARLEKIEEKGGGEGSKETNQQRKMSKKGKIRRKGDLSGILTLRWKSENGLGTAA